MTNARSTKRVARALQEASGDTWKYSQAVRALEEHGYERALQLATEDKAKADAAIAALTQRTP
jgi:hypothetical protein